MKNTGNNINKDYDFEIENITGKIKKGNFKLVGLQFPEGLKRSAVKIAGEIEAKTQAKTIIFIDPTYGACDIKLSDVKNLNIDLLVHLIQIKI
ncbi:MAG: hypothetical protein CVT89_04975 [Candidatus Altiarchaeales archaeon HGW-Altiarchaeales-2]|nr:MAG: hypothetical protein CVT89_04975 [Candidatus Altiarchaeales archaeon HGW-Altiarchaeales-2]